MKTASAPWQPRPDRELAEAAAIFERAVFDLVKTAQSPAELSTCNRNNNAMRLGMAKMALPKLIEWIEVLEERCGEPAAPADKPAA